ncbi:MAG: hypothetical protein WC760_02465 [Bacteroidia bacterium]|jgi:hypothetical protein
MKTKSLVYLLILLPGLLMAQTKTQKVQGIECTGQVKYYANGNLEVCSLAKAQIVSQLELPDQTVVCFNPDQTLRFFFLEKPTLLNGHLCKGHGHDWMQCIYPNGQPKLLWLEEDEIIQGIPCSAASFWSDVTGGSAGVHFYENGKLAQCKLSTDFTYEGKTFEKGQHLMLDKNGKQVTSKS